MASPSPLQVAAGRCHPPWRRLSQALASTPAIASHTRRGGRCDRNAVPSSTGSAEQVSAWVRRLRRSTKTSFVPSMFQRAPTRGSFVTAANPAADSTTLSRGRMKTTRTKADRPIDDPVRLQFARGSKRRSGYARSLSESQRPSPLLLWRLCAVRRQRWTATRPRRGISHRRRGRLRRGRCDDAWTRALTTRQRTMVARMTQQRTGAPMADSRIAIGEWTDAPGTCPAGTTRVDITSVVEMEDASPGAIRTEAMLLRPRWTLCSTWLHLGPSISNAVVQWVRPSSGLRGVGGCYNPRARDHRGERRRSRTATLT